MAGSTKQYSGFVPGKVETAPGDITLNEGRDTTSVKVQNIGDRPVQIGSHYHFYEANPSLIFDREATKASDSIFLLVLQPALSRVSRAASS